MSREKTPYNPLHGKRVCPPPATLGPPARLRPRRPRFGAGVLRPPDANALRKLLGRHIASASPPLAALPKRLRLLPLGRRPRRRNRRRPARARSPELVPRGVAALLWRHPAPPRHGRAGADHRPLRHLPHAVPRIIARLRAGPVRPAL